MRAVPVNAESLVATNGEAEPRTPNQNIEQEPNLSASVRSAFGETRRSLGQGGNTNREERTRKSERQLSSESAGQLVQLGGRRREPASAVVGVPVAPDMP